MHISLSKTNILPHNQQNISNKGIRNVSINFLALNLDIKHVKDIQPTLLQGHFAAGKILTVIDLCYKSFVLISESKLMSRIQESPLWYTANRTHVGEESYSVRDLKCFLDA